MDDPLVWGAGNLSMAPSPLHTLLRRFPAPPEALRRDLCSITPGLIDFRSNDYLGMTRASPLRHALEVALAQGTTGAAASPLVGGWTPTHAALAARISEAFGTEDTLLFSSGYAANLTLMSALFRRGDEVLTDHDIHASLIDGLRLAGVRIRRYRHLDIEYAGAMMQRHRGIRAIVTDGLFSMSGDTPDLHGLLSLAQTHGVPVLLDDAHGFATLGAGGLGVAEAQGVPITEFGALTGTFGKAFGLSGAFVTGPRVLTRHLIQSGRGFIYSTAMPTLHASALCNLWSEVIERPHLRQRLHQNIDSFAALCAAQNLPMPARIGPIQPLELGSPDAALAACAQGAKAGLALAAFRPPTVAPGTSRIRVVISAAHRPEELALLVSVLANIADTAHGQRPGDSKAS